jgi:integrase
MGSLYRRTVKYCTTCQQRRVRTADWRACTDAGHAIVTRERPIWWVKYNDAGRLHCVSAHSTKRSVAQQLLASCEFTAVPPPAPAPVPTAPPIDDLTFETAAEEICREYRSNGRRSLRTVELRIAKYLKVAFGGRAMSAIRTSDIRAFTAARQAAGAANASINRDLVILKRMYTLAIQGEALVTRPYIPLLKENNVRRGFFEQATYEAVRTHLPLHYRGIVEFAYITGWRTPSEILPLEWRQVDLKAGEVRLDPGTTKNGEGRVFPFTSALRRVLETQRALTQHLGRDEARPSHVFCYLQGQKAGQRITESGFHKAWRLARTAAGCPDRIPHDFRRTAVRNLVRAGVPERVAMQLTGHKTRAIFERYNIVNAGDLSEAAERLDQYLVGQIAATGS